MAKIKASVLAAEMEKALQVRPPYDCPGVTNYDAIMNSRAACDCSGLPYAILKHYNVDFYHGSNTIARKYMSTREKLTKATQLEVDMAVFKWSPSGGEPDKYKSDGLGDFHHIGICTSVSPLRIVHQSSAAGCTTYDTNISKWQYCGRLSGVNYENEADPVSPDGGDTMYQAKVKTNVNVRQGRGTDKQKVGLLQKGTVVNVYQNEKDWCRINYNDQIAGWCIASALQPIKGSTVQPSAPADPADPPVQVWPAGDYVNRAEFDALVERVKKLESEFDMGE